MSVDTPMKIDARHDEPVIKIDAGDLDVMRWIRDVSGAAAARLRARENAAADAGIRAEAGTLTFTKFFTAAAADLPPVAPPLPPLPPLPTGLDLVREQLPTERDFDATWFAAQAKASSSVHAFQPMFSPAQWRTFASFCVVRHLAAHERVAPAQGNDRTLRFVLEGRLGQDTAATPDGSDDADARLPGDMLGAETLFTCAADESDRHALEDSLVLELPRSRHTELTAAHPLIGFELLRAAGAVVAARGRRRQAMAA